MFSHHLPCFVLFPKMQLKLKGSTQWRRSRTHCRCICASGRNRSHLKLALEVVQSRDGSKADCCYDFNQWRVLLFMGGITELFKCPSLYLVQPVKFKIKRSFILSHNWIVLKTDEKAINRSLACLDDSTWDLTSKRTRQDLCAVRHRWATDSWKPLRPCLFFSGCNLRTDWPCRFGPPHRAEHWGLKPTSARAFNNRCHAVDTWQVATQHFTG